MNEKVKSMHSNWYRDNKLKSYYKTKMVSHAQQEKLHKDHNAKNEKIITDLCFNGNDGGQGFLWQPVNFNICQVFLVLI
jgi:hypothetical protein